MAITASTMPAAFAAGETIEFIQVADLYPASEDWELELAIAGPSVLEDPLTADVDGFGVRSFTLPSTLSAQLAHGFYRWTVQAVKSLGGDPEAFIRKPVAKGFVSVTLDLFNAEAGEALSFYERALVVLYAAFENRIPKGLEGFQIYNRTVSLMPLEKVADLIARFEQIVSMRKWSARGRLGRQYRVRFTGTENETP